MATILDFINSDLPSAFGQGFLAGFIIAATIYGIRAVVKLFIRTIHGRG